MQLQRLIHRMLQHIGVKRGINAGGRKRDTREL